MNLREQLEKLRLEKDAEAARQAETTAAPTTTATSEATESGEEEKDNAQGGGQSSQLVAFVLERADLLRDGNRDVYARDKATREVRKIGSESFADWLSAGFYGEHRKAVRRQAMTEAASVLVGMGRETGEAAEVLIRSAFHDKAYFLDLGEEGNGRAVRVTSNGWSVEDSPPVHFIRPRSMRPIAPPTRGGSIAPLWEIANIPEEFRVVVVAWLCECLRPETPFPILEISGEEGSAKSTTQRALRLLIDPNASLVDNPPRSEEDLLLSAADALVCSIENVSHLTPSMQDAFCRLATGAGMKRRKLYSDSEVVTLTFKRPVVLNGIAEAATASDMVNRTITVELPKLTGGHKEETTLWDTFNVRSDGIRGALLDIFAEALQRLPAVTVPKCEDDRLPSFMRLGVAVAEAMGAGGDAFLTPYLRTRQEAGARILEGNSVGAAILDWVGAYSVGSYTPKEWMDKLKGDAHSEGWPRTPRGMASTFKRLAPALRRQGVDCCAEASRSSRGNLWRIGWKDARV